jgi:hypothetical protein
MTSEHMEDFFQWILIVMLFVMSITTLIVSLNSFKVGKEVNRMDGKIELLTQLFIAGRELTHYGADWLQETQLEDPKERQV